MEKNTCNVLSESSRAHWVMGRKLNIIYHKKSICMEKLKPELSVWLRSGLKGYSIIYRSRRYATVSLSGRIHIGGQK